jgi:hypothetical protein
MGGRVAPIPSIRLDRLASRRGPDWLVRGDRSLKAQRRENGLRLGEFGELLCRREALGRRRQHGVRVGVAIGRAIKLRKRQRGAQFEAAGFLRLRDRGLQSLLGRRRIGRVAFQQDLGADAVYLRFVQALLGGLQLGERIVQAPETGISLGGTGFGFASILWQPSSQAANNAKRAGGVHSAVLGSRPCWMNADCPVQRGAEIPASG